MVGSAEEYDKTEGEWCIKRGGYTRVPNWTFDVVLRKVRTVAEIKVLLVVFRQTTGWNKESDVISYSQFQKGTGLTRESVAAGVTACINRGTVERVRHGARGGFSYRIASRMQVERSDQFADPTSAESRPEGRETGRKPEPATGRETGHTKDKIKEKIPKERESANADGGLLTAGEQFFLESLGRKRFANKLQRDAVRNLEAEVGLEVFRQAVEWAARKGISDIDRIATAARKMAKGGGRQSIVREPSKVLGPHEGKYARFGES